MTPNRVMSSSDSELGERAALPLEQEIEQEPRVGSASALNTASSSVPVRSRSCTP